MNKSDVYTRQVEQAAEDAVRWWLESKKEGRRLSLISIARGAWQVMVRQNPALAPLRRMYEAHVIRRSSSRQRVIRLKLRRMSKRKVR